MPIQVKQLHYIYYPKSPFEYHALKGVDLTFQDKLFTAVVGHTGCGKSTLVQHLNALLRPTSGEVTVNEYTITHKTKIKHLKQLRKVVGMVFQFPEYQLFEETVFKDIAFGPKNFGKKEEDLKEKVLEVMRMVGLDESYLEKSPFDLSGGQKRRVAIAGILAMDPDILVLDEPLAGLDPQGAKEMIELFQGINRQGKTIIMISHYMDSVLEYCDHVIVMKEGNVAAEGSPNEIFTDKELLQRVGIVEPEIIKFARTLQENGLNIDLKAIKNLDTLIEAIKKAKGVRK